MTSTADESCLLALEERKKKRERERESVVCRSVPRAPRIAKLRFCLLFAVHLLVAAMTCFSPLSDSHSAMGRKNVKATEKLSEPETDVSPLKALKLWCLRKCTKQDSSSADGLKVVTLLATEMQKPAWMREGNLNQSLWKELPDELLEHVLAFLPFVDLFRHSTVCKRWQSLIDCPQFQHTRAESSALWPSYSPIRYNDKMSENGEFHWSGYSTRTNKWQQMPPLSLPCLTGKKVWAGAGGLLCFYNREKMGRLVVCNPVTRKWRELPAMNQKWRWPCVTHMIVDPSTKAYKIIMAGTEAYPRSSSSNRSRNTEVYSSILDKWECMGSLPADLYLDTQDAALHNGILYCTAQKAYAPTSDALLAYDALVAYDVTRGVWTEISSELPDSTSYQTPLICGDRVMMVVAPLDDDGPVGSFYILHEVTKRWNLVTSMPESMHRSLGFWGVCGAEGNKIYVVGETSRLVVVYDVLKNSWKELPSNKTESKFHFLTPISFQPDVSIIP